MRILTALFLLMSAIQLCALPAESGSDRLIVSAERQAVGFLDLFSEVKCTEQVSQEKLKKDGKVEYREQSRFDYLLIAQSSGDELSLQESRLEEQGATHKKNVPLLVTNGFATLLLVFHPYYKDSFQFSPTEEVVVDGQRLSRIRFRHVAGKRTPSLLVLRGREYPLSMNGTAWIDAASGNVVRIQTELQQNMEDIGLRVLRSDVLYAPVHFRDVESAPWLPSVATVEVETARQHWRNVHRFSNYQHFGVDTQTSSQAPLESGGHSK